MTAVDTPSSLGAVSVPEPATFPSELPARGEVPLFAGGALCGKYVIVRLIARGGMSEVYEALHQDLHKRVALKVLSPGLRDNAEAHARFAAEAINAASVGHTNVIDIIDFGQVLGLPYLVMSLLVGTDLATLYARRAPLPVTELLDLVLPVGLAVALGHERGVMHRDLKPENIFLHQEAGRIVPKLLDFGVSRMLGAKRITANAHVFGTPQYMAPEQARGESTTDPRADQYALGVILYEGLTGRLPRNDQQPHVLLYSVAFGSFLPPSVHVPLPEGLEHVILRAMARDPRQRFASVRELVMALLPYASPALRAYWLGSELRFIEHRHGYEPYPPDPARARLPSTPHAMRVPSLLNALGERPALTGLGLFATLLFAVAAMWLVARGFVLFIEQLGP